MTTVADRLGHVAELREAAARFRPLFVHAASSAAGFREQALGFVDRFRETLDRHREQLVRRFGDNSDEVLAAARSTTESLISRLEESKRTLIDLAGTEVPGADGEPLLTIAAYGRTRAGKSTLVEALRGGDGAAVGTGFQGTTTEVQEHSFAEGLVRLLDVPGFAAVRHRDHTRIAHQAALRSDLLLFVFSDDAQQAEEFEELRGLNDINRPWVILLNVKSKVDVLLRNPSSVFRADSIRGHVDRISSQFRSILGISRVEVLPIHARAALDSHLTADPERAKVLWEASRLPAVLAHLSMRREGLLDLRVRRKHDILWGVIEDLVADLRSFATDCSKSAEQLQVIERVGRRRLEDALASLQELGRWLADECEGYSSDCRALPDELRTLEPAQARIRWHNTLSFPSVSRALESRRREALLKLGRELKISFSVPVELVGMPSPPSVNAWESARERREQASTAQMTRAGVRAGAYALTAWGIANFWNPSGWAALAAAAGTGVVVTEGAAQFCDDPDEHLKAAYKLEASVDRDLQSHCRSVTRSLEEQQVRWEADVRARVYEPLDRLKSISDHLRRTPATTEELRRHQLQPLLTSVAAAVLELGARRLERWDERLRILYSAGAPGKGILAAVEPGAGVALQELSERLSTCWNQRVLLVEADASPQRVLVAALPELKLDSGRIRIRDKTAWLLTTVPLQAPEMQVQFWLEMAGALTGLDVKVDEGG